jgi:diguanylate cyclase (GGDEF)-like protein
MTERILLEKRLRDLVEHDTLTRLHNRHSFENELKKYTGQTNKNLVIVSIDVNGLKFINDTLGHLIGDETIINAANIISHVFQEHGYVARIGGDEFGIILDNTDEKKIEKLLNQLHLKVDHYNSIVRSTALSLAYGYSYHKEGTVNVEFLFQEADNNMYQNKLLKKESYRNTFVKTFMKALEVKDYISEGHADRMETLAAALGEGLTLRQDQMDRIVLLTKFHDIGKIGIPDSILKKPDKLTEDEWKVMRTHSSIGERIAMEAAEIKDIAHLILKHHEKWDGTGYPIGLFGEEIPLECRILAIVDTFDAMTNDRPYRKALPMESAVHEIRRCKGTQFDPSLVELFCQVVGFETR